MPRPKGASSEATKKASSSSNEFERSLASKEIAKKFGDGVVINGRQILDNPKQVVSLTPALDAALGGGLQVGSFAVFAGQPRTGKTTTALNFAAHWQALGWKVVYINAESRLEGRNLDCLPRPEDMVVIGHTPGKILSAEDFLDIALLYLKMEQYCLVIIDSISVMSEERELVGGMGTKTRGGNGVIMGQFCRLATPIIPVNNNVVIGMAQLYANTSGRGKEYFINMGKKADYALFSLLYATHASNWTASGNEDDKTKIGQINHWRVERSPLSQPGNVASSYLRYGLGIDEAQEYLQFAKDLSLYESSGAWYYYPTKEDFVVRAQGAENFYQELVKDENKEAFDSLKRRVRELAYD
jgi:recombination protein RecA